MLNTCKWHLLFRGEFSDDICGVTEWSPWSECSVMCGEGVTMRTRHFLNRMGFKKCSHVDTVEKETCTGIKGACDGEAHPSDGVSTCIDMLCHDNYF